MMNLFTLGFKISSEGFDELQGQLGSVTDAVGALGAAFTSLKGIQVGQQLVREFTEAQSQSTRLRAAVEGAGLSYTALRGQIDDTIESMMRLTTIEDDAASGALSRLVGATRDIDKSLRGLRIAQEFAARGMLDLEGAAVLVGKAINGNTTMLSRYGIEVDKTRDVLDQLDSAFSGVAEAQAKTLGGAITQSQVQLGNFREALGEAISQTFNLEAAFRGLTSVLRTTNGEFSPLATSLFVAIGTVGTLTAGVFGLAAAFVTLRGALLAAGGAGLLAVFANPALLAALVALTAAVGAYAYQANKAAKETQAFRESLGKRTVSELTQQKNELDAEVRRLTKLEADQLRRWGASTAYGSLKKAREQLTMVTEELTAAQERETRALEARQAKERLAQEEAKARALELKEAEEKAFDVRVRLAELTDLTAASLGRLSDEAAKYERIARQSNITEAQRLELLERAKRLRETVGQQATQEQITLGRTSQSVAVRPGFAPALGLFEGARGTLEQRVGEQLKGGMLGLGEIVEDVKVDVDEIVKQITSHSTMKFLEMRDQLRTLVSDALGDVLGQAVYDAFASAFSGEGIGGLFRNFGKSVLAGLGKIFVMMGQYLIGASGIFKGIADALINPLTSGWALAAYGAALIALGAGMGAIASRGSSDRGMAAPAMAAAGTFERQSQQVLLYGPNGSLGASVSPRDNITVNLIGKDDPRAQREIMELFNNAQRRGML